MSTELSDPITVDNICLDFELKAAGFEGGFSKFLDENKQPLALDDTENLTGSFIERLWPDGLPGSMVVSHGSFDNYDRYLIRPAVDGPASHSFASGGLTVCFGVYRHHSRLVADSFYKVPHVPLRPFERYVTGTVHINTKTESMGIRDFDKLTKIKRQRNLAAKELDKWSECLSWQKNLVFIGQDSFRYLGCQPGDNNLITFLVRADKGLGRLTRSKGTIMLAAAVTDSSSAENWKPYPGRKPNFTKLGKIVYARRIRKSKISKKFNLPAKAINPKELAVIAVRARFDPGQLEGMEDSIIPEEGFLLSSVGGDIKPITSAQRTIGRIKTGNGFNCYLPDFCFDIRNASKPIAVNRLLNSDIPFNLNDDQAAAVNKILSAHDIVLLQGPPGTGKTYVITAGTLLEVSQGKRVLISSQTNIAIDNVLTRLNSDPAIRPLRIGAESRVEPQARIFLEDNAPKAWFKAISKACLRKNNQNAKLNSQIKDARHALEKLKTAAGNSETANQQLIKLQRNRDSLNRERAAVLSEHKDALTCLSRLKQKRDSLVELSGWLSSPDNSLPRLELADEPKLLSVVKRSIAGITELLSSNDFSIAYIKNENTDDEPDLIFRFYSTVNAAENLSELIEPARCLCGRENNPTDIEKWSRLCLDIAKYLEVIFDKSLPADAEDLTASLKPEEKWLPVISRLEKLCGLLTCQCREIIDNTFIKLKACIEHSLSGHDEKAGETKNKIQKLRQELEDINYRIADTEYETEDLDNRLQEYRLIWQKYWPAACPGLKEPPEIPPDIKPGIVEQRTQQLKSWLDESENRITQQNIWDSIRTGWMARLSNPEFSSDSRLIQSYKKHANVVGLTCLEAGQRSFYQNENFRPFDTVIIDEVSKATPPELLMPMMCGIKVVLAGDYRQLPPMCRENERSFTEALEDGVIEKDDFERHRQLVTSSFFEKLFYQADDTIKHSLSVQYRMNPQIMACVNQCYENGLIPAGSADSLDKTRQHGLFIKDIRGGWLLQPHQHILWIDSTRNQHGKFVTEQQAGSSKVNFLEIELIAESLQMLNRSVKSKGFCPPKVLRISAGEKNIKLADYLKKAAPALSEKAAMEIISRSQIKVNGQTEGPGYILKEGDTVNADLRMPVGVITFYGAQLGNLRKKIAHIIATKNQCLNCLDIRTNTVDKFQGMEMPVVIVSLVRSRAQRRMGEFVKEYRRINVALSRAQNLLVIVGSELFFRNAIIDLPDINTGDINQLPLYKNIHNIITGFGGRRYAKQILR